ncbi:MAG: LON peptidase substrate-binding domain-containing protein [Rhodothermales bacterium]|nr:LON peptidase substrate-binding domain-containing protein [Rhodothermales bacterium]MCA0269103.1 LON peptidase substrate-binding domain-containing protein [Bacteroidota bacterium]
MPDLPLFPLQTVLYPGERLPLHIFEPRYRTMIARCLRDDLAFGLVLSDAEGHLADVGCTARLDRILERYPDGRLDLLVRGETRFRIETLRHEHAYLSADVAFVHEPAETLQKNLSERAITQHMRLLELARRDVRPSLYMTPFVSYVIAHNAGLTLAQKQEVLELLTENLRLSYLVAHLEALIPQVEQQEDVRRKVQSNGHFRDFLPRISDDGDA